MNNEQQTQQIPSHKSIGWSIDDSDIVYTNMSDGEHEMFIQDPSGNPMISTGMFLSVANGKYSSRQFNEILNNIK